MSSYAAPGITVLSRLLLCIFNKMAKFCFLGTPNHVFVTTKHHIKKSGQFWAKNFPTNFCLERANLCAKRISFLSPLAFV